MKEGDVYQLLSNLGEVPAGLWVVVEVGMSRLTESSWTSLFECDRLRLHSFLNGDCHLVGNCTVGVDLVGLQEHPSHVAGGRFKRVRRGYVLEQGDDK